MLLFVVAAATGLSPSTDGDIWWHLAAGREMVARGAPLFTDPFSLSAAGRAWTDVHWLFQLAAFGVHQLAGLRGLVLIKCALIGLGAWLLLSWVRRDRLGAWAAPALATWLVAALFLARSLLLLRPVIITLVFTALFLRELELFRADHRRRRLVRLALAQLVWANFQGLSALGPAIVGAYLIEAGLRRVAWRQLLLAVAGCLLASSCTPFGWRGLSLSRALLARLLPGEHNVYAHTIAENVPPFVLERWTGGEFWHFKWYCLLLGLALVLGRRRLRPSHGLLLAGFGTLALLGNRNVLLFYWVTSPIAALHVASAASRHARLHPARARWFPTLNGAALLSVLLLSGTVAARETTLTEASPFRVPAASIERLATLPDGGVFCADHYGGYLIWSLFPRMRPYMDTRLVLRTADEYAEYLDLADFPERFDAFQERHHFGYVLLPVAYPDRYLGLIAHVYRSRQFELVYTDGSEALFARRDLVTTGVGIDLSDSQAVDAIERGLERRFSAQPPLLAAARLHLATLELAVGELKEAERVASQLGTTPGDALLQRIHYLTGDLAAAAAITGKVAGDDARHLTLLSRIALARGDSAEGARYLRQALATEPFDLEARQLLSHLEASQP